jgi:hypothetical protein
LLALPCPGWPATKNKKLANVFRTATKNKKLLALPCLALAALPCPALPYPVCNCCPAPALPYLSVRQTDRQTCSFNILDGKMGKPKWVKTNYTFSLLYIKHVFYIEWTSIMSCVW